MHARRHGDGHRHGDGDGARAAPMPGRGGRDDDHRQADRDQAQHPPAAHQFLGLCAAQQVDQRPQQPVGEQADGDAAPVPAGHAQREQCHDDDEAARGGVVQQPPQRPQSHGHAVEDEGGGAQRPQQDRSAKQAVLHFLPALQPDEDDEQAERGPRHHRNQRHRADEEQPPLEIGLQAVLGTDHHARQAVATGRVCANRAQVQYVVAGSQHTLRQRQQQRPFPAHASFGVAFERRGHQFAVQPDTASAVHVGQIEQPQAVVGRRQGVELDPVPGHRRGRDVGQAARLPARIGGLRRQRIVAHQHHRAPGIDGHARGRERPK